MNLNSAAIIKKLLLLFLLVAGLYLAKAFLIPLALASIIATLFLPFCNWMDGKKFPPFISVLSSLLILLSVITLIFTLLGWQINELANDITLIKQKVVEIMETIQQFIFNHFGISAVEQSQLLRNEQSSVTDFLQAIAGSVSVLIMNSLLVLVYVFLLLYYRTHIKNFMLKMAAPHKRENMEQVIYSTTKVSQQYLLGLTKMIACLWIMYGVGFSLLGVKNPLFFAFLCGLLEIIPFIGNITGTTITVLVAVVHGASLPLVGGIIVTYGTVQLIQGWLLEPLILGPQVKINPLFTIIALVAGELIWGVAGIILAIPVTAMIKIVCDNIESLKPYGFLIGEIASQKKEPVYIKKIKKWAKKKE